MTRHRVLLFGGHGQIGQSIQKQHSTSAWDLFAPTRDICDFLKPSTIAKTIRDFAPDIVLNAAAMTDVNGCENNIEFASEINFRAVANVAAQCTTLDAPLVHLSTDYVFDGRDGDVPYKPDDAMNPLNIYGHTKMMGEEAVRHAIHWHVILRTSLVFSATGNNILTRTLRQIDTQDEVIAAENQIANPTSAPFISKAIIQIADQILGGKAHFGTFHLAGAPAVSRFDFLQTVFEAYKAFTTRRPSLKATILDNTNNPVPRPLFSALDMDKTYKVFGFEPHAWQKDLASAIEAHLADETRG